MTEEPDRAFELLRKLNDGALTYDKCGGPQLDSLMIEGLAAWADTPAPGRGFGWRLVKITQAGRERLAREAMPAPGPQPALFGAVVHQSGEPPQPEGAEAITELLERRIREGEA